MMALLTISNVFTITLLLALLFIWNLAASSNAMEMLVRHNFILVLVKIRDFSVLLIEIHNLELDDKSNSKVELDRTVELKRLLLV
jgi:hypothetical protein